MQSLRKLKENENADVRMIGAVVGILVTLIIATLVFYNIAASIDISTVDSDLQTALGDSGATYAANATEETLDMASTFFTIAPIIAIVIVAVVILGYVGRIGG